MFGPENARCDLCVLAWNGWDGREPITVRVFFISNLSIPLLRYLFFHTVDRIRFNDARFVENVGIHRERLRGVVESVRVVLQHVAVAVFVRLTAGLAASVRAPGAAVDRGKDGIVRVVVVNAAGAAHGLIPVGILQVRIVVQRHQVQILVAHGRQRSVQLVVVQEQKFQIGQHPDFLGNDARQCVVRQIEQFQRLEVLDPVRHGTRQTLVFQRQFPQFAQLRQRWQASAALKLVGAAQVEVDHVAAATERVGQRARKLVVVQIEVLQRDQSVQIVGQTSRELVPAQINVVRLEIAPIKGGRELSREIIKGEIEHVQIVLRQEQIERDLTLQLVARQVQFHQFRETDKPVAVQRVVQQVVLGVEILEVVQVTGKFQAARQLVVIQRERLEAVERPHGGRHGSRQEIVPERQHLQVGQVAPDVGNGARQVVAVQIEVEQFRLQAAARTVELGNGAGDFVKVQSEQLELRQVLELRRQVAHQVVGGQKEARHGLFLAAGHAHGDFGIEVVGDGDDLVPTALVRAGEESRIVGPLVALGAKVKDRQDVSLDEARALVIVGSDGELVLEGVLTGDPDRGLVLRTAGSVQILGAGESRAGEKVHDERESTRIVVDRLEVVLVFVGIRRRRRGRRKLDDAHYGTHEHRQDECRGQAVPLAVKQHLRTKVVFALVVRAKAGCGQTQASTKVTTHTATAPPKNAPLWWLLLSGEVGSRVWRSSEAA